MKAKTAPAGPPPTTAHVVCSTIPVSLLQKSELTAERAKNAERKKKREKEKENLCGLRVLCG
jgi:hypothetical protein